MVFVPEGQHDSSQARSAWNHEENSPRPSETIERLGLGKMPTYLSTGIPGISKAASAFDPFDPFDALLLAQGRRAVAGSCRGLRFDDNYLRDCLRD